jgi:hypothetical protein
LPLDIGTPSTQDAQAEGLNKADTYPTGCAGAGFNTLFARTEKSNQRSANVLLRSRFQADTEKTLADEKHDWFVYNILRIN